jgi:exodeoxyribonuclease V alpha subunit
LTVHSALRPDPWRPTRFRHDASRLLPADIVLLDEASMVDLALMAKLADAVDDGAHLVLMGDADQLASVEAGAVFGDICRAGLGDSAVQLAHSYRYRAGSGIARLAAAINAGDATAARAALGSGDAQLVEVGSGAELAAALAPSLCRALAALRGGRPSAMLAALSSLRVLCAHRGGGRGADALNALVEGLLRRAGVVAPDREWYEGRPILVVRNDYQLGLFNGDVGVIARDDRGELTAFFPAADGGLRALAPARLPPHETVFAMTVHKSQGSEFDSVALVLPEEPSPILTRELLYTAVTRARTSVAIYGSAAVLAEAIPRRIERASGLREELGAPAAG